MTVLGGARPGALDLVDACGLRSSWAQGVVRTGLGESARSAIGSEFLAGVNLPARSCECGS